MRPFLLLAIAATSAWPAELVISLAVERDGPVPVVYRTNQLATGKGELSIRWTDVNGRVVDDRRLPVDLLDENEIGFTLDLRRAVSMRNELTAHLHFVGVNKNGEPDRRDEDVKREFIASPPDRQMVGLQHRHVAESHSGAGSRPPRRRHQRGPMGRAKPEPPRVSAAQ